MRGPHTPRDRRVAGNDNNNRSKQLHFHNVQLDSLHPYAQNEVHSCCLSHALTTPYNIPKPGAAWRLLSVPLLTRSRYCPLTTPHRPLC